MTARQSSTTSTNWRPRQALMPPKGESAASDAEPGAAAGAIEKAGAVVYERHFHPRHASPMNGWRAAWAASGALVHLDGMRGAVVFRRRMTQADVTIGCLMVYLDLRLRKLSPAAIPGWTSRGALRGARCFREGAPEPDEVMPGKG